MSAKKITAMVTGASAGLGAEFCRQLADRCDVIIAVARRRDRLAGLAEELAGRVELHPLEADLNSIEGVARTMEALRQQGPVDYLVNNAGFSTFGHFADLPIDSQRDMVSLHIDATITLCSAAVPFMRERGAGCIINVSSVGAFLPGKGIAVYGATKAFLNFYSQALQAELAAAGIAVQALCPGYIRTDFHQGMDEQGFDRSRIPAEMWMEPAAVVAASLEALGSGRVLVVPGAGNLELAEAGTRQQLDALTG
jgi:short-subunit dehydrogenase